MMLKTISPSLFALGLCSLCACSAPEQENKTAAPSPDTQIETAKVALVETAKVVLTPGSARTRSQKNLQSVSLKLAKGLTMENWAVDALVADPIAIDINDQGQVYLTRTIRQKNSEYDIRAHREWELDSVKLRTVEEKRAFLHKVLAPEKSEQNQWLTDLNGDGSHDWRDVRIEKERVYRVEDSDNDGLADTSTLVVEDFNDEITDVAGAILAHEDALFVGVGPDMWRMEDRNNDGYYEHKQSMAHGFAIHVGFSGHGMSGAELGPDGRIYWGIGDIGFHGKGADPDGKVWNYPNRGVIARANPDGSDFEIFAMGVRNTHEFAFDEYGNLISVDNDGDHNGEKERLVYLTNGSDSGWRISWQLGKYRDPKNNDYKVWMDEKLHLPEFAGQAAHITPAIATFVSGPTGFTYNPGTALSPAWKNTFFVVEFVGTPSRGGIHAFKLAPEGASFRLDHHEKFMSGVLATGLDFAPDGALYVADWIDGWGTKDSGRIWKIDAENGQEWEARQLTARLLPQDFSAKTPEELAQHLHNDDMRVRLKAQLALVKMQPRGQQTFQTVLQDSKNQLARIHAIWGLSQIARAGNAHAAAILIPYLKDSDEEIRAQIAKWLGDIRYGEAAESIVPLLQDTYPRARFFAAEALGRMAYKAATQAIIDMLRENNNKDAYLRHAGSLALARMGDATPLLALENDASRALRIAAVVSLRRLQDPGVAEFLNDQDEYIVTEAARAINDDYSIEEALPALAKQLNKTKFTNEALVRRIINANVRWGTNAALDTLVKYLETNTGTDANSIAMRHEAISSLTHWVSPSEFDRVDGRHRGKLTRPLAPAQQKSASALKNLCRDKSARIRAAAATALGSLGIKSAAEVLGGLVKNDKDTDTRIAALLSLAMLEDNSLEAAIELAMKDKNDKVKSVALTLLGNAKLEPKFLANQLLQVIDAGSTIEKQTALKTLAGIDIAVSRDAFTSLIKQLSEGQLDAGIVLDTVEATEITKDPALLAQLEIAIKATHESKIEREFPGSLAGGDPEKGKEIAFKNSTTQCVKCHTFFESGGIAGPRLNKIGNQLSPLEILGALVEPSSRIAPGYGYITLKMQSGETISGVYQGQSKSNWRVKSGDDAEQSVAKSEVAHATLSPSSMPDIRNYLSKREIRDLVSFLSQLK